MIPPANYEVFQLTGVSANGVFTFRIPYGYAGRKAHIKLLHLFTGGNTNSTALVLATQGLRGDGLRTFHNNKGTQTEFITLGLSPVDEVDKTHYSQNPMLDCQITGDIITVELRNPTAPGSLITGITGDAFIYLEVKFANGKYGEEMPESMIHQ